MTADHQSFRTAGTAATSPAGALAFSLLAVSLVVLSAPAAAQYCKETIAAVDSAKAARIDHESEQKTLLDQIDNIVKGEQSFRQQLESGDCRPEGAAATNDKRPSCKVLLQVIQDANKMRGSLKQQIDTLKRMAADAVDDEQKLIQLAKSGGCPPYAVKPKAAEPQIKAPPAKKKAARKPPKQRSKVRRPPQELPPRRGGGVIFQFGRGGGVGVDF